MTVPNLPTLGYLSFLRTELKKSGCRGQRRPTEPVPRNRVRPSHTYGEGSSPSPGPVNTPRCEGTFTGVWTSGGSPSMSVVVWNDPPPQGERKGGKVTSRSQTEKTCRVPWKTPPRCFTFNIFKSLRCMCSSRKYKRKYKRDVLHFYLILSTIIKF